MASVVDLGYVAARSKIATPPSSTSSPHSTAGSSKTTMTSATQLQRSGSTSARLSVMAPVPVSMPATASFMPKPVTPPSPGQLPPASHEHEPSLKGLQSPHTIQNAQNMQRFQAANPHGPQNSHRDPHTDSLHTHRQHHNSSKLPAFRFVDLKKKDAFTRASRLPHMPPPPVPPGGTAERAEQTSPQAPEAAVALHQPHQTLPLAQTRPQGPIQPGTPFQNTLSATSATTPTPAAATGATGLPTHTNNTTSNPVAPKRRNSAGHVQGAARANGATNGATQPLGSQATHSHSGQIAPMPPHAFQASQGALAQNGGSSLPFSPSRPGPGAPARSRASMFQTLQTIPSISSLPATSPSPPPSLATTLQEHHLPSSVSSATVPAVPALPSAPLPHPPHTSSSSSTSSTTAVTASSAATNTNSTNSAATNISARSANTNYSNHPNHPNSQNLQNLQNYPKQVSHPTPTSNTLPLVANASATPNTPGNASALHPVNNSSGTIIEYPGDCTPTGRPPNSEDIIAGSANSGSSTAPFIPDGVSNTTSATAASAKLQRTLTDPSLSRSNSHRRAPASFSSNGLETAHGPPSAFTAKRLQAFNVQTAASAAAQNEQLLNGNIAVAPPPSGPPSAISLSSGISGLSGFAPAFAASTTEWTKGQRELILPKAVEDDKERQYQSADDKRKLSSRPPISFRPPRSDGSSTTSRAVIPPIRSFRSSGSRKSLVLDMSLRSPGAFSDGDSVDGASLDPNQRDRTLRALEGRTDDERYHSRNNSSGIPVPQQHYQQQVKPEPVPQGPSEAENTADLFLRIAHEDTRNCSEESDDPSNVSRAARTSSQRRPYSAAVPTNRPSSPSQVSRRLSDQRETSRQRRGDENGTFPPSSTRDMPLRAFSKDSRPPVRSTSIRTRTGASSRTSPTSTVFYDAVSDVGVQYSRRRPSITDSASAILPSRTSSTKTSHSHHAKAFSSSPLVPRSGDILRQEHHDVGHSVVEGTESSASTAAPSTVWDELDELKTRMRRLELTGKRPATAGAAMSRISDDRPPTAMTNATTVSGSPRRSSNYAQTEIMSTTSSQHKRQLLSLRRDSQTPTHSTLITALHKARPYTNNDVYSAIEAVASEALSLSQMVGVAGKPGLISSGASSIGTGGPTTPTDRQLRRRAENICRSLTELCLALNDDASQRKASPAAAAVASAAAAVQAASQSREEAIPPVPALPTSASSPTVSRAFSSLVNARRAAKDQPLSIKTSVEPRTLTRVEERRASFLATPTLASSPRLTVALATPASASAETTGRRSSLLLSRTRRAASEEVEDSPQSGRRSSLLRMRRAATEEPEEGGRRTSHLLRTRKAAVVDEEDELRARPPSRAATEVGASPRTPRREHHLRDYPTPVGSAASTVGVSAAESSPLQTSALPRRRFVSSNLASRLTTPQSATTTTPSLLSGRRFLERTTPDRETSSAVGSYYEDRASRQLSLSQAAVLNRTNTHRANE